MTDFARLFFKKEKEDLKLFLTLGLPRFARLCLYSNSVMLELWTNRCQQPNLTTQCQRKLTNKNISKSPPFAKINLGNLLDTGEGEYSLGRYPFTKFVCLPSFSGCVLPWYRYTLLCVHTKVRCSNFKNIF
jgi:hypothetical protein